MAVAAYYAWDRLGRPLDPAVPIRQFVERMKAGFPRAAHLFSWHADEAHYQAEPPQDHTPFSATGWPEVSPFWWVFATDIMHRPDLGVDCNVLFPYWLGEAKAGRMPWLKYMIWQAKRYDVRNAWRPVTSSGHFTHVHHSDRTDHRLTSLGSWDPTGLKKPGDDTVQMLVKNADDGRFWLVDGMGRRPVKPEWIGNLTNPQGPITNTQVHQAGLLGNLRTGPGGDGTPGKWMPNGQIYVTAGDMDVWGAETPEPAGGDTARHTHPVTVAFTGSGNTGEAVPSP